MDQSAPDQDRYERAKRRVEMLRGFYGHLLVYVLVNVGLAAYNLATSPQNLWFVLTTAGWAIGIVAHGAYVWSSGRFLGAGWEARMIREEMERDAYRSR
jgi:2TM domain-containing protein